MITGDLEAAYHRLYELVWSKIATVGIDVPGYNGISYADCNALDEACVEIEVLLAGKPGKHDAARGAQ